MAFAYVILILSVFKIAISRDVEYRHMERNTDMCKMFARTPFFESELVMTQWRIYYSWNMQIGPKCVDISFKNATKEVSKLLPTKTFLYAKGFTNYYKI